MRLRGIGPEVLLLCFLLVGAAAFVLGRRTARGRRLRRDLDYFTGLDHLVNDRYDRATEVFTRLANKSHEADIQFALGSLMRKRGEVDRAIAIHSELAGIAKMPMREQATYALGLDYMSAGLMDRAEEKLRDLMGSPRYRAAVLEKLAWVYEQQRDWRAALDLWRELPPELQRERAVVAAHYCCELGEAALAARDFDAARAHVAAARVHAAGRRAGLDARRAHRGRGGRGRQGAGAVRRRRWAARAAIRRRSSARRRKRCRARPASSTRTPACQPRRPDERPLPEPARFRCEECGVASVTWHWRCPSCRNWDSLRANLRG